MPPSSAKRPASREGSPTRSRRSTSFSGRYDESIQVFPLQRRSEKVLEHLSSQCYPQLYTKGEGTVAYFWPARVCSEPGWDPTLGVARFSAVWSGGKDDGKVVHLPHPLYPVNNTNDLHLDSYLLGLAGHALGTDTFRSGFYGIRLSSGVNALWPEYESYAEQFARATNLLLPFPTGIISFDSKTLAQANYGAEGTDVDDGLQKFTVESVTQSVYEYFELDLLLRSEKGKWLKIQLDPYFVSRFRFNKPVSHSVEVFELGPEHIHGREGLAIGGNALRATKDLKRGVIVGLYTGDYVPASEASKDPKLVERQFAVDFAGGAGNVIIEPRTPEDKMQYINDVAIDLANKHGNINVSAFQQNAMFFPIELFHFPIILVLITRDVKKGQEIGGDYGALYRLKQHGAGNGGGGGGGASSA